MEELIEPKIQNMQDRLQGMIAITNCLGWGFVTDSNLMKAQNTQLTIKHSYYIDAYKNRYGKNSEYPICYMWTGTAGGYGLAIWTKAKYICGHRNNLRGQVGRHLCF